MTWRGACKFSANRVYFYFLSGRIGQRIDALDPDGIRSTRSRRCAPEQASEAFDGTIGGRPDGLCAQGMPGLGQINGTSAGLAVCPCNASHRQLRLDRGKDLVRATSVVNRCRAHILRRCAWQRARQLGQRDASRAAGRRSAPRRGARQQWRPFYRAYRSRQWWTSAAWQANHLRAGHDKTRLTAFMHLPHELVVATRVGDINAPAV
jgi:hypothetical protein